MKRLLATALLASVFACTTSVREAAPPTPAASAVIELEDAPATSAATPVEQHGQDLVADVIPTGVFANVGSFRTAQKTLIIPRMAEANLRAKENGATPAEMEVPSCKETPEVLTSTTMDEFIEVKAVSVATGGATSVFLLVNGKGGWTAIRTPFLTSYNDDPGCGSIEREASIKKVHTDGDALVVTTESGRTYWKSDDDRGELTLTHARACHPGAACAFGAVVQAKAVTQLDSEVPTRMRFFHTSYTVDSSGAIIPATVFDETQL